MIAFFENPSFFKRFPKYKRLEIICLPIDEFSVIVYDEHKRHKILPIIESPAYKYLIGQTEVYLNYLPLEDKDHQHSEHSLLELLESLKVQPLRYPILVNHQLQIIDGQHRASVIKFLNKYQELPALIVSF